MDERIYRAIFDAVMDQRLAPGTRLPEAALCELFGATRPVVRRVLQRLAHDRIVELRRNRGAIVAVPSPEETRQIFEARRGLEAAVLRLAAEKATAADLKALRRQLKTEHDAMHRMAQPAWARLASSFHLQLAALARNPILEGHLIELISRCSLIVAVYQPPGNATCEHDEHARIVDCIAQRDAGGAIELMDSHLLALERNVALEPRPPQRTLGQMLGVLPDARAAANPSRAGAAARAPKQTASVPKQPASV